MKILNLSSRYLRTSSPVFMSMFPAGAALLLLPLLVWSQTPSPPSAKPETSHIEPVSVDSYILEPAAGYPYIKAWPYILFKFRISNKLGTPFDQLKLSDVKARFDNQPITEGMLSLDKRDPVRVLVLIDSSLSMVKKKTSADTPEPALADPDLELDKLKAALAALQSFINSLKEGDTLSVYAFDEEPYFITPGRTDIRLNQQNICGTKAATQPAYFGSSLSSFTPREEVNERGVRYAKFTNLYGAIEEMIGCAQREKITTLVVLSDGMQDTVESKSELKASEIAFANYKRKEEEKLVNKAQKATLRIFTIAVGDKDSKPQLPDNLKYVDDETLKKISNDNTETLHQYVGLPELKTKSLTSSTSYQDLLTEKLKGTFETIQQSLNYDYSLTLKLTDFPRDGRARMLEMNFPAGNGAGFPTMQCPLFWKQGGVSPEMGKPVISIIFVNHPKGLDSPPGNLWMIYSASLGVIMVMSVIPLFFRWAQRASEVRAQERAVSSSVIKVRNKSSYIGQQCPNDPFDPISLNDVIVVCPQCGRAHHIGCWVWVNYCCMVRNCPAELDIPPSVLEQYGVKVEPRRVDNPGE